MEEPFLHAVKIVLGDRYTDSMDGIYKQVAHFILENLVQMCEKEHNKSLRNGSAATSNPGLDQIDASAT